MRYIHLKSENFPKSYKIMKRTVFYFFKILASFLNTRDVSIVIDIKIDIY